MLQWFDDNPARTWWLVCLVTFAALFALVRPLLRADWQDVRRTDWRWALIIAALLAAGRWPTWFVTRQLDPDENEFIAGAMTLRHDPVFWRSVDGRTSGPLVYYALLPAGWLHGGDNYLTARVTGFLLLGVTLTFMHQACALLWGVWVARVAGFPALCFESLALRGGFLHYSSELVPLCLLALALWLLVRRFAGGASWPHCLAGGLALGAVPFSKPQAAPLAVLLGLAWLALEIRRHRRGGADAKKAIWALLAGSAVPVLACAGLVTAFAIWPDVSVSYLASNAGYVGSIVLPFGKVLGLIWREATAPDSLLPYWLGGSGLWLLLFLPAFGSAWSERSLLLIGTALFGLASLACILVPQRPFLHYWQLLVLPWTLIFAGGLEAVLRKANQAPSAWSRALALSALVFGTAPLLLARANQDEPYVGRLALYQAHPMGRVARVLRKYAAAGESLGVWGWMTNFYVEADLRQATREAFSQMQILDNPDSDYYRRRYLSDLQRSAPPVFVDAIGPVDFGYPPELLRHDVIFPALAAYVRDHYTKVAEMDGVQIFVRHDRLQPAPP